MVLNQSQEFLGNLSFGATLAQANMIGGLSPLLAVVIFQGNPAALQENKIKYIINDAYTLYSNFYPLIQ